MKTITVRNIPDDVYRAVVELAGRNRRSIQQQVIAMLERARRLHGQPPTDRAAAMRARLKGRELGDTVEEVREERRR
jgi:plasmid stability protein